MGNRQQTAHFHRLYKGSTNEHGHMLMEQAAQSAQTPLVMIPLRPQSGKQGRSLMNVQGISSSFGGLDPRKSMHTQQLQ